MMNEQRAIRPQQRLEMTMRDVLGNMEEMVSGYGFRAMPGEFEILAIERGIVPEAISTGSAKARVREIFGAELLALPLSA